MGTSKLDNKGVHGERGRPMMEPIEANYVPDGDDWTVTIVGRGKTLTGKAPGLIAARDRADQLVEELAGDEKKRTVVHRLEGDALEFTSAYLNARLAKPEPEPEQTPAPSPAQAPSPSPSPEPEPAATAAEAPAAADKEQPAKTP
jgi:hypothetical protein